VHEAVRQYVRVIGEGEFEAGQADPAKVDATSIEVLYESVPLDPKAFMTTHTVASLVQGRDIKVFRAQIDTDDPWRNDDEADALIAAIENDRS
jgi:hypothetical protein